MVKKWHAMLHCFMKINNKMLIANPFVVRACMDKLKRMRYSIVVKRTIDRKRLWLQYGWIQRVRDACFWIQK